MAESEHNWDDIPSLSLEMDDEYNNRLQAREGRRHARVDTNALKNILTTPVNVIPIRIATALHGVFDGVIADLSQSGVRLSASEKLSKDEKARVGFKINDRTIIAKAIIRWTCQNDMYCTAGLEFEGLSSSDEEFLGALATAGMFNKTGAFKV
ncbi:MAG: PilZ domain-containing protein [Proteobacteria bacterium]|nr:PilZ domain-containing protein [Pseudomonadota bacterium]MBU1736679.1 PilZ domain-containing protein [Pseudomonadota bacterium]